MQTIELGQGASLVLWEDFLDAGAAAEAMISLCREVPFEARAIRLFGRAVAQPRRVAYHGDPEARYTYSGVTNEPLAWTPTLASLRVRVSALVGRPFNAVLCNLYRDGRDSMGMHSDDEPELGPDPVVASLSLGAARRFSLRPKRASDLYKLDLVLPSGSLLVMSGGTQRLFRHGVPKVRDLTEPRVNLTFRRVIHEPLPGG